MSGDLFCAGMLEITLSCEKDKIKTMMEQYREEMFRMEFAKTLEGNRRNQVQYFKRKLKRFRTAFSTDQLNFLEKEYKKNPYICIVRRREVAKTLNMPERPVKIWFQNRRMREKIENNGSITLYDSDTETTKACETNQKEHYNNKSIQSPAERLKPVISTDKSMWGSSILDKKENKIPEKLNQISDLSINDKLLKANADENKECIIKIENASPEQNPRASNISSAEFSISLCKKYKTELKSCSTEREIEKSKAVKVETNKQEESIKDFNTNEHLKKLLSLKDRTSKLQSKDHFSSHGYNNFHEELPYKALPINNQVSPMFLPESHIPGTQNLMPLHFLNATPSYAYAPNNGPSLGMPYQMAFTQHLHSQPRYPFPFLSSVRESCNDISQINNNLSLTPGINNNLLTSAVKSTIWRPINLISQVPLEETVQLSNTKEPSVQVAPHRVVKKNCNCTCHGKDDIYPDATGSKSQYVINAYPFLNNSRYK